MSSPPNFGLSDVANGIFRSAMSTGFLGFDPYDALSSYLLDVTPLLPRSRYFRLAVTQLLKRCPFNPRPALSIPKQQNPKTLALLLDGAIDQGADEATIRMLADRLMDARVPGYSGACWGYPFPWQSRAFYLPARTPTVVATSYSARALLNASRRVGSDRYFDAARTACEFVTSDLARSESDQGICFSYSPIDKTSVLNASLLGATLLWQVGTRSREDKLLHLATSAVDFVLAHQSPNGRWAYGLQAHHKWTDNFHTGFILECLSVCQTQDMISQPDGHFQKGLEYYEAHLFTPDGTPQYYDGSVFPLDAHVYAQAVITLLKCRPDHAMEGSLVRRVLAAAFRDLWHPSGYFRYQRRRFYRVRINYLRWSQAWMFRALAAFLRAHPVE